MKLEVFNKIQLHLCFLKNILYNIIILHRREVSHVFDSFVKLFHIMEDWFSRETAIWMVIVLVLVILLSALNTIGVPDYTIKKTSNDTWTIFKRR